VSVLPGFLPGLGVALGNAVVAGRPGVVLVVVPGLAGVVAFESARPEVLVSSSVDGKSVNVPDGTVVFVSVAVLDSAGASAVGDGIATAS